MDKLPVYHNVTFKTGFIISQRYVGTTVEQAIKKASDKGPICGVMWDDNSFSHVNRNNLTVIDIQVEAA